MFREDAIGDTGASDQVGTTGNANGGGGSMRPSFEGRMAGGFKGHDEGRGSVWNVLLTYLGIMGVFVVNSLDNQRIGVD